MSYNQAVAVAPHARETGDIPTLEIDIPRGDDWLSAEELASLTPAILRDRVKALQPLIAERARSVELNRRPDPEVWAALRKTGIFYMFLPKKYGGLEMEPEALIDILVPISEACASTGWCATFMIEHNLGFIAGYPHDTIENILKDFPYIIAAGVQAPPGTAIPVEGGYRVTGRWKSGSGIMNSDWVMASVLIPQPKGPPEMANALIRARDVAVLDTWHMDGMAGTGSNDVAVEDLFVPAEMIALGNLGVNKNAAVEDAPPLLRLPFLSLLSFTTMLPALGCARAAVDYAKTKIATRTVYASTTRYLDKETTQARIGRADAMTRSAEALLRDAARRLIAFGRSGEASFEDRAGLRSQIMIALELCRDAVRSLIHSLGASAHQLDCPLQRYQRDVEVVGNHPLYDADIVFEQRGRAVLGLPQSDMLT